MTASQGHQAGRHGLLLPQDLPTDGPRRRLGARGVPAAAARLRHVHVRPLRDRRARPRSAGWVHPALAGRPGRAAGSPRRLVAPGGGRRGGPRRAARGRGDRDGIGQDPGLPAARPPPPRWRARDRWATGRRRPRCTCRPPRRWPPTRSAVWRSSPCPACAPGRSTATRLRRAAGLGARPRPPGAVQPGPAGAHPAARPRPVGPAAAPAPVRGRRRVPRLPRASSAPTSGAVLRRLRRVAAAHGASPTFVLASATVAEAARTASRLTGLAVRAVEVRRLPRPGRRPAAVGPRRGGGAGRSRRAGPTPRCRGRVGRARRRPGGAPRDHGGLRAVPAGHRDPGRPDPGPARGPPRARDGGRAGARGGALPRRAPARGAARDRARPARRRSPGGRGHLRAGARASTSPVWTPSSWPAGRGRWPRCASGPVGPAGATPPGTAVMVARDDPLDAYVLAHPALGAGRPRRGGRQRPGQPVRAAAPPGRGGRGAAADRAADLPACSAPGPRRSSTSSSSAATCAVGPPDGTGPGRPGPASTCAAADGGRCSWSSRRPGRVLGTVEAARAEQVVHPGAVYQHLLRTYLVVELDLEAGVAVLHARRPGLADLPADQHQDAAGLPRRRSVGSAGVGWGTAASRWCPGRRATSGSTPPRGADARPRGPRPARTLLPDQGHLVGPRRDGRGRPAR